MIQGSWRYFVYKFFRDLGFDASIDHRDKNWRVDDPYSYRCWYTEDIQDRETLLITVGDSWTFGDHLGKIDWERFHDDPVRLTQIYGRLLADQLSADWVNLARPGCSNYWMLEKLQDIEHHLRRVQSQYKRIIVIITLTEDLREATYTRRIDVTAAYDQFCQTSNTLKDFLVLVENYLFDYLNEYFSRLLHVDFYVSRAFTDSWSTRPWMLDRTWCDVIQDQIKYNDYQQPVPFIAQMSINPLKDRYLKQRPDFKQEFVDIMEQVESRWGFLGASKYNLKGSTCHPNPLGHQLWADYLRSKIDK